MVGLSRVTKPVGKFRRVITLIDTNVSNVETNVSNIDTNVFNADTNVSK